MINSMEEERYKVGDKVYLITDFHRLYSKSVCFSANPCLLVDFPLQKKITQVVHNKAGNTLYQVKGGHFDNSWIGVSVYDSLEEAKAVIEESKKKLNQTVEKWLDTNIKIY